MTMTDKAQKQLPKELTGRQVISWFVAFFAVIIAVNGVMTYLAIDTFSGIETEDAYRKGRDFNQEIERARAQDALGWQVAIKTERVAEAEVMAVTFADSQGQPLDNLKVNGLLFRPVHKGVDLDLKFAGLGHGRYQAVFEAPVSGKWQVQIAASGEGAETYRLTQELFLSPPQELLLSPSE